MGQAQTDARGFDTLVGPGRRSTAEQEFQEVFSTAYSAVVSAVYFIVQDRAVAEDIAQDAFVQLLRRWDKIRGYDRPDLWVRRVAIQCAQRERQRNHKRTRLERGTLTPEIVEDVASARVDERILAAVATLGPKQRAIVVLFYFEDLPMPEIADIVGCSVSSGWSQLHHARKHLAALLHEEATDDVR